MVRRVAHFLLAAALAAACWALFIQTPSGSGDPASFDPDRLGVLETRMWKAYYARQNGRLFGLLILAVREQYRLSWAAAARSAFHLARAAALFGSVRSDYGRVLPEIESGYRVIRDETGRAFGLAQMAQAELAWWTARRDPDQNSPESVGRLIAQANAVFYGVTNERLASSGLLRAQAAALRDQGGAAAPWERIEEMLKESYRDLRDGLRQPAAGQGSRAGAQ